MNPLLGYETRWQEVVDPSPVQRADNDLIWEVMFVYGDAHNALRSVKFAGMEVDPLWVRSVLIRKQGDGERMAAEEGVPLARCALCRLPFDRPYVDEVFGTVLITRNARNRYYCNVCDTFIRLCPGKASLTLPVLVVDVKGSRTIRRELRQRTGSDLLYSRALATFHRRVTTLLQEHHGFVLNTIGDAVVGVWPSGFVPDKLKAEVGWDPDRPARVSARQAIEAAESIARMAPQEFDGANLPFRGAVDTTEMTIFSVSTGDPVPDEEIERWSRRFARTEGDEEATNAARVRTGDPTMSSGPSDIGTGPVATDVAGDAIEYATALTKSPDLRAGQMYVTARTFEVAEIALSDGPFHPVMAEGQEVDVRLI